MTNETELSRNDSLLLMCMWPVLHSRGWTWRGEVGQSHPWPDQAKPIWGFLDFNVHQPATGHNLYFGPDFFGFDILGGNGVHGGVQASPNSKYMGVRKL